MVHLGVIGLGNIFEKQKEVLDKMKDRYCLEGIFDFNQEKRNRWGTLNFYSDVKELFEDKNVEVVLISTPPKTHFEIAEKCLQNGKHVILEKPATVTMSQLTNLHNLAKKQGCMLYVAYHAGFAKDLLWFLDNWKMLEKKYAFGKLKEIHCQFFDPYMQEGRLLPQAVNLCGSYLDSGVNALSVCDKIMEFTDGRLSGHEEKRMDKEDYCTTFESVSVYENDGCRMILETGFSRGINYKETELFFENTQDSVVLCHSKQSVYLKKSGKEMILLYENLDTERLTAQYEGVFEEFYHLWTQKGSNTARTFRIHRLLFSPGDENS